MPQIFVSRNGNSHNLKLRDSEGHNPGNDNLTTNVSAGDMVEWMIDPNESTIASLNGISKYSPGDQGYDPNSVDLLTASGAINAAGNYYANIVTPSPGSGKYEKYQIAFTVPNDTTVYTDDPKLQMN